MDHEALTDERPGMQAAFAFGRRLQTAVGQLVISVEREASTDQTDGSPAASYAQTVVGLIDALGIFEGRLVFERVWRGMSPCLPRPYPASDPIDAALTEAKEHVCILARYGDAAGLSRLMLLTTADALPRAATSVIREQLERASSCADAVVFLGGRRLGLSANDVFKEARTAFELESTQSIRLLHTEDLLAQAERRALDVPSFAQDNRLPIGGAPTSEMRPVRARSVLLGNGINNINNYAVLNWGNVLRLLKRTIASTSHAKSTESNTVPSPIRFECLADHPGIPIPTNNFSHLKDTIAKLMLGSMADPDHPGVTLPLYPPPNELVDRLRRLSARHIMTTNYDQILEATLGVRDLPITDKKYLLHPTGHLLGVPITPTRGSRVWPIKLEAAADADTDDTTPFADAAHHPCAGALAYHIHGIAADKHRDTICIGYEHYMGYVQRLRSRLIQSSATRELARRVAYLMLGLVEGEGTWEELFFTTDLAIVGLGLDYEEADLWELLTLRAAVLYTSKTFEALSKAAIEPNRIVYYDIEPVSGAAETLLDVTIDDQYADPNDYKESKLQVLSDLGIEVRIAHVGKDASGVGRYQLGYRAILDELHNRGW